MKSVLVSSNTRLIVALFAMVLALQIVTYFVATVKGEVLPMGRLALGVIVFGVLAIYYSTNNLWQRIGQNQWVVLFCVYVAVSFVYGFWQFRTPTTSIFDLWFFAFIPAILLIPAFSFDARVFDRVLAIGVVMSIFFVIIALIAFPETLYDRRLFSDYVHQLAAIGAGSGYLLLKYAERPNSFTIVGVIGVLTDAVTYGVGGAFRGRLILAILLLILFLLIILRSRRAGSHLKLMAISGAAVAVAIAAVVVVTQFGEQAQTVAERFQGVGERYERTGDLAAADSRILEYHYFMHLNPAWKLVLGHGVGGLWYDFYGMFEEGQGEGLQGARTMLHINWLHILFKIGFIGFVLLLVMLVSHFRRHRGLVRQNWGWWAFVIFYLAWTTYYGDKELGLRSIMFLFILIHPWLFRIAPQRPAQPMVRQHGMHHLTAPPRLPGRTHASTG